MTPRPTRPHRAAVLALGLVVGSALGLARLSAGRAADVTLRAAVDQTLPSAWSVRGGGTWVRGNGIVRQADNALVDPKKYVVPGLTSSGDQAIVAQVRVDGYPSADSRVGVALRSDLSTGFGYNFVLLPNNQVGFLADSIAWGATCAYSWSYGQWYWLKLSAQGDTLTGKIWTSAQTESQATVCTQSGWSFFPSGAPGLNGGSFGETASFDNVTVGTFADDFNANAPPAAPEPPANFLTSGQFLSQVQTTASGLGFDLGHFVDLMQATAQSLVCANHPDACVNYTPGTFAVVPSPFYSVGTWMRDATWELGALNNVDQLGALTSKFAAAGNGTAGQIATLIPNNAGPWFGAGGQGNPLPDDDSNFMFAIAARLGWQTAASQSYLNSVYNWIHGRADASGMYPATSHGWLDSFYPLGTSGAGSVTVSANMQGLYAVALRSLKDLGVNVPQSEIDSANAQYANLSVNGRLAAYQGSDIVDVSSLEGEALSLFIWNQPILSDAVVQNTIASFAEVYDQNQNFVGYKVLSNADGTFLAPSMFPVENNGAGVGRGDYQNGGSWMLYDVLALYAGTRHNIPSMRATYSDRLVKRMASELRAGVGSTPAGKSNEFLCTAPGLAGDPCGPTGSAVPERSGYGWNTFVVRLLSDQSSVGGSACAPVPAGQPSASTCPVLTASPAPLRFAATKAGPAGDLISVTPRQTITVQFPSVAGAWTATADQAWMQLTRASGIGNGQFDVGIVNPVNVLGSSTSLTATITVTPADTSVAGVMIPVTLTVDQTGTSTSAPFGQVDTPVQSATGVVGAIGVTGWVVDDVGVAGVKVYRNCLAAAEPRNCQTGLVSGVPVVFIADAVLVPGARPDVEAAFPTYPAANQAGWGVQVLTNMLPRTTGTFAAYGGEGPITFYVIATDVEGHTTLLSRAYTDTTSSPTSITMDNDTIAKPFGAIDTPAQGGTVSGTFPNFGWALTPDDGSYIFIPGGAPFGGPPMGWTTVYVDGVARGDVNYSQCRGTVGNPVPLGLYCDDDVASIFGNLTPQPPFTTRTSNPSKFRNLDSGNGAIGAFDLNTTTLTNGMHSIAWGIKDSHGRVEGIGSRNFFVLNAGADAPVARDTTSREAEVRALMLAPAQSRGDAALLPANVATDARVMGRVGFDLTAPLEDVAADGHGVRHVRVPDLGRVELQLGGPAEAGYLVVGDTLRDLPIGSHLDGTIGTFTWAPGPGYLGTYRLVFVRDGAQIPIDMTIRPIVPAGAGESEIRMNVDLPSDGVERGPVTIAGWALDPQAWTGSGIGVVHVWAYRRDAPSTGPQFVGAADLSGVRPDVARVFGSQFDRAGFGLTTTALTTGEYDLVIYAWCARTGRWEDARTVRVVVR